MGFLGRTFRQAQIGAATPENPRFSLNDPAAWDALSGNKKSASGLPVNGDIALTYGPWFRGINLVSNDVAKLPLFIYKRRADGGKERALDHPAYKLLRRQPNERQTAFQFKKLMIVWAMTKGNAYAAIERLGGGQPEALLPLSPDVTFPVLDKTNGRLWYVTSIAGTQRKLLPENVLHFHGMSSDGIMGVDVVEKARDSLGLGLGAKRYMNVTLRNNGRPSIVLQIPIKMQQTAIDNLRTQWERLYSGIDNAARTAVLDQGMVAKEISFTPRDAQLKDVQEMEVRDIACFLNLPPHKLGDTSRTAYSSLEMEQQSYLDESLDPWLVTFEDQCWEKLLTEEEKADESHVIEFLRGALVRANLNDRANYYRTATGGRPWMVPDEVREMENMNAMGGEAAELKDPLNMGQGGPDNEQEPPGVPAKPKPKPKGPSDGDVAPEDARGQRTEDRSEKSEALSEWLGRPRTLAAGGIAIRDVAGRLARRVAVHAIRAAGKGSKEFVAWVDSWTEEDKTIFRESCRAAEALVSPQNPGQLADYLLVGLEKEWKTVAAHAKEKDLLANAKAAAEAIEINLADNAVEVFLS